MSEEVTVRRIRNVRRYKRESDEPVWRCCRNCNAEIPASSPNNAYCDRQCKKESMAREMGFGWKSGGRA